MPIDNSAPTLGASGATLYRQTQLASLPIRRVTAEEHRAMLAKHAQGPVIFDPDHTTANKRRVEKCRPIPFDRRCT